MLLGLEFLKSNVLLRSTNWASSHRAVPIVDNVK